MAYTYNANAYINTTSSGLVDFYDLVQSPEAPELSRQLSGASSRGPLTPSTSPGSSPLSYSHQSFGLNYDAYRSHHSPGLCRSSTKRVVDMDWSKYDYIPADDGGYWQLNPNYATSSSSPSYPPVIPAMDVSSYRHEEGRDVEYTCLMQGCTAKSFKRKADLERHYRQVHVDTSQRDSFTCDYSRCPRRHEPFGRRDHYRDHLREYHKEDIQKRSPAAPPTDWWETRHYPSSWWRCSKCLIRVDIGKHRWECTKCKAPIEDSRRQARRVYKD